ncbi:hypothetical protein LTR15_004382 [Elasticomyces elasticus]|nr:hypothetical protein LTR15_004382 [Elasticomyces elasticus]
MSNTQTHSSRGPRKTARRSALPVAGSRTGKCLECCKILPDNANLCIVCQESTKSSSAIPALDDDDNFIRLLQSNQEALAFEQDEQLHFHISVHSRDAAPAYNAISYTWGDLDDIVSIFLDGHTVPVTYNCHFALWQAQFHHPRTYIWVDSVCIDQSNDAEKSSQVARMADLYARAIRVLMCVGHFAHDDLRLIDAGILDDQNVQDVIGFDYRHDNPAPSKLEVTAEDVLKSWQLSSLSGQPAITTVREAVRWSYESLLDCSYFGRLWVYQEFTSSRRREILHGRDRLLDHRVNQIISLCRGGMISAKDHPHGKSISAGPSTVSLSSITSAFGELECADPRDRLYGIIGLVDWRGEPPIKPDYSLSRFELACLLHERTLARWPKSPLDRLQVWMKYFQVDEHDSGKQRMLSARISPGSSRNALHELPTPPLLPALQDSSAPKDMYANTSYWTSQRQLYHQKYLTSLSNAVSSSPLRSPGSHEPLMLHVGNICVGYLCNGARPGDVVASFEPSRNERVELHLVLRKDGTSEDAPDITFFMVVGQAVMATNTICRDFAVATKRLWGRETNLSTEDWALFWYQAPPLSGTYQGQNRLMDYQAGRLFTPVSDSLRSGPSMFAIQNNNSYPPEEGLRDYGALHLPAEDNDVPEDEDEEFKYVNGPLIE